MPATIPAPSIRRLETAARAVVKSSYSPYSNFRVGAAVLAGSGKIYAGTNIENASYGLCMCAERIAIFAAASAGNRALKAIVIYTPTVTPTMPCGACRQVINEFGPDAAVIAICDSLQRIESSLPELLQHAFGPADLVKASRRSPARKAR